MYLKHEQVIIAQCTPQGPGALAVLRLSGLATMELIEKMVRLSSGKQLHECATHTVHLAQILDDTGQAIDQVMITLMRAPKTFTGQDTVEISCHNNPFIVHAIIHQACTRGARLAGPGEFAYRAVLNGKMDILQAEAINELIHAATQQTLKQALAQVAGSFSAWIVTLEKKLYQALALCEASFEFIDEEITFDESIIQAVDEALAMIARIKRSHDAQQQIRQGIRIALVGSVNAGKSSLFNALVGTNRAIVTEHAGTTRDTIEAGLYRHGTYWTLIDTAGLRETKDIIEQEGIARSHTQAAQADVVLVIIDGSHSLTAAQTLVYQELIDKHTHKAIIVITKTDLPQQLSYSFNHANLVSVSSATGHNLAILEQHISAHIKTLLAQAESPYLLNQRHYTLLVELESQLHSLHSELANGIAYELVAYHLREALASLSNMTGKTVSEQAMDAIFKEFCVGK